jgi:hypothetical protein
LHSSDLVLAFIVCTTIIWLHLATGSDHVFLFIVNLIVNFFTIESIINVLLLVIGLIFIDTLHTILLTR